MEFALTEFSIQIFTSLIEDLYHFTNVELHLHHSHVKGYFGYSHDFYKCRLRKGQIGFSCLAHFFGFDI